MLTVTTVLQDYFAKWPESGVVDLAHEFSELIILTASRTLMGMPYFCVHALSVLDLCITVVEHQCFCLMVQCMLW